MHHDHAPQLDRIERAVAHQHAMLHGLAHAVADIAHVLAHPPGGLTADETAQLTARLLAHDLTLKGIVAPQPVPPFGESKMAIPQSTADVMKQVDDDTTAVGNVVLDLRAQIKAGVVSQADVDAINATLTSIGNRLMATAADPVNPVPPGPLPQFTKK